MRPLLVASTLMSLYISSLGQQLNKEMIVKEMRCTKPVNKNTDRHVLLLAFMRVHERDKRDGSSLVIFLFCIANNVSKVGQKDARYIKLYYRAPGTTVSSYTVPMVAMAFHIETRDNRHRAQ